MVRPAVFAAALAVAVGSLSGVARAAEASPSPSPSPVASPGTAVAPARETGRVAEPFDFGVQPGPTFAPAEVDPNDAQFGSTLPTSDDLLTSKERKSGSQLDTTGLAARVDALAKRFDEAAQASTVHYRPAGSIATVSSLGALPLIGLLALAFVVFRNRRTRVRAGA